MQSETNKVLAAVKDRRILLNPAEAFGDYWPTYVIAAGLFMYFRVFKEETTGASMLFFGVLLIALSAARDSKKEVHRKIDAIVRRMEVKEII